MNFRKAKKDIVMHLVVIAFFVVEYTMNDSLTAEEVYDMLLGLVAINLITFNMITWKHLTGNTLWSWSMKKLEARYAE